ncbi:MAG: hypothetical protein H0U99_00050 [Chthoniobacterales bacterium]|nr:hypothetical protein [Chthoniobacterales bacterium]
MITAIAALYLGLQAYPQIAFAHRDDRWSHNILATRAASARVRNETITALQRQ